ncbi:uncharacterized protein Bfra_001102 [Botrytis fragariae]|uniref:Uncharacterized protein n=1 Tax=Botrytis fragariae TaxID=1964551 RepID=A0A8H6B498_9HELO|nr:uncharacterized protein Bfra_001102 [Botrytis fragariae]KAF5878929.1 hypothetical protein Bfra_001102 [Botrytis fragariae]
MGKRLEDQKEIARQAERARRAERTRQEMPFIHRAPIRQEELSNENVPIRKQPSAPKESPSQGVAQRYVGRQLDLEERGGRREGGYRSQTGHSSQAELARQIEHTKEGEHRRPTQDTKQGVAMRERESHENEDENASDRIQKQLEQEYIAEETHRKNRHERERPRFRY